MSNHVLLKLRTLHLVCFNVYKLRLSLKGPEGVEISRGLLNSIYGKSSSVECLSQDQRSNHIYSKKISKKNHTLVFQTSSILLLSNFLRGAAMHNAEAPLRKPPSRPRTRRGVRRIRRERTGPPALACGTSETAHGRTWEAEPFRGRSAPGPALAGSCRTGHRGRRCGHCSRRRLRGSSTLAGAAAPRS